MKELAVHNPRPATGVVLRTRIVHHFGDQTGFNEIQHLVPLKPRRGRDRLHDRAVLELVVDGDTADLGCFLVGSDDVRYHASRVKSLELVAEGGAEIAALAKSLKAWLAVLEG
jgi:hypothetical protein